MVWNIEKDIPGVEMNGLNTDKPGTIGHVNRATNSTTSTVTLTAAQVALGYIYNTAGTVTMTLPTGTLLGNYVGAQRGTTLELYVDNTASTTGPVTVAVATNGVLSDAAATTSASFGQLTVAAGTTGIGRFTIMFASGTAYVFTRTA